MQVSSHELSFRVRVRVPDSGNYTIAARPSAAVAATTASGARRRSLASGRATADGSVTFDWEVDLSRPETLVVSRPGPVTTLGKAVFGFACEVDGLEPEQGCRYEYQMVRVTGSEVDLDKLDWLPTVRAWWCL